MPAAVLAIVIIVSVISINNTSAKEKSWIKVHNERLKKYLKHHKGDVEL